MKKLKVIALACAAVLFALPAACKPTDDDPQGKTTIRFWASGMQTLTNTIERIVNNFNESQDEIYVNLQIRPEDGYADSLQNTLSFSSAPDVFMMQDRYLKKWAKMNLLKDITASFDRDETVDGSQFWDGLLNRFRYDVSKNISTDTSPLYALPCGNNPSVVYYNKTAFEQMGIEVISKDYSDTLPEREKHGFYRSGVEGTVPTKDETLVFNNRIPMTWEELKDLCMYMNKGYNRESVTDYGYYSHWWFNFGWSVGGDCITYDEAKQQWLFTLGDTTRKTNSEGVELPSMREALEFYMNMVKTKENGGWQLMPSQAEVDVLGNDVYFMSNKVAMLIDVSEKMAVFMDDCAFEWDIAPAPKHKDGIEAAHSQSTGIAIWNKTKKYDAAYTFLQYMLGREAQTELAMCGEFVPNQKDIAYAVYSDKEKMPAPGNAKLLAEVCEYERPGDWTYMPDDAWLNEWANLFNSDVRNNKIDLDTFFERVTNNVNVALARYTK